MSTGKALLVNAVVSFIILYVCLLARVSHAQWITLYAPQQTPVSQGQGLNRVDYNLGREAFNAFGCGECHADLAERGYKSGFRLLPDSGVAGAQAVSALQGRLYPLNSPNQRPPVEEFVLGGQTFVSSARHSSVFLRKAHSQLPLALRRKVDAGIAVFDTASPKAQEASLDYMLMF